MHDVVGSSGSALAVVEPSNSMEANVGVLMRRASDVAGVCRDIVMKTAQTIQQRKYVRVEGWQSIAVAYGCVASARDVEVVPGGVRAIGEVRRMSDGQVIATAEGFVGDDEKTWAARPMYARRAMAQTRSISRACRSAFAFVVTLIDEKLSTTPAEEMDGIVVEGSVTPPAPTGAAGLKAKLSGPPPMPPHTVLGVAAQAAEPTPTTPPSHDREFIMPFANKTNEPLHKLSEKSLRWFRDALTKNVSDPAKAQYADNARKQLALIEAEMVFRGL
jgi:hypothetical protein